jgi:hypothetical protein
MIFRACSIVLCPNLDRTTQTGLPNLTDIMVPCATFQNVWRYVILNLTKTFDLSLHLSNQISLKINEIERKIDALTFKHNVSQQTTYQVHDETKKAKEDLRSSSRAKRESAALLISTAQRRKPELDAMHEERVVIRADIERYKQELSKNKRRRDVLLGIKSVHFN